MRVTSAIVREVSVLSPGVNPAEPLARVVCLTRERAEPEDEIIYGGPLLVRPGIGRITHVQGARLA